MSSPVWVWVEMSSPVWVWVEAHHRWKNTPESGTEVSSWEILDLPPLFLCILALSWGLSTPAQEGNESEFETAFSSWQNVNESGSEFTSKLSQSQSLKKCDWVWVWVNQLKKCVLVFYSHGQAHLTWAQYIHKIMWWYTCTSLLYATFIHEQCHVHTWTMSCSYMNNVMFGGHS
jgi:hypothetical protein